jgi:type I thyroxine 5'-deiodinase
VAFFLIYIQEAHSSDSWQVAVNERENIVFKDPQAYDERVDLAGTCSTQLGIEFPALVDTIDNSTESAYTSWPDRIYVIDANGRIAFKSDPGPFGFKAQQLSEVLSQLVPSETDSAGLSRR